VWEGKQRITKKKKKKKLEMGPINDLAHQSN